MRLTPQIFILIALTALIVQWFFRSFIRLNNLRMDLERQYKKIENHLKDRERALPLLEQWIQSKGPDDQRINDAIKSMNHIHKNIHFDFQLQQQKISNQLCHVFRFLKEHELSDAEYVQLESKLYQLDEHIQSTSRQFNDQVDHYNNYLNAIPASWVANQFGFFEAEPFELKPLN